MKKLLLLILVTAALMHGLRAMVAHSRLADGLAAHRAEVATIAE